MNPRINRYKTILIHIALWFTYATLLYFTNLLTRPSSNYINFILFLIPHSIAFYLSVFVLGFSNKYGLIWGVISFVIVFLFITLLGYLYIYVFLPGRGVKIYNSSDAKLYIQNAIIGYIQFFSLAALYYYLFESIKKERKVRILNEEKMNIENLKIQKELENANLIQQELNAQKEKLQFEYSFLRAQINPHFLHNTLNMLFSQAMTISPPLAENILKLSRIMRYSLESLEFESGKVSIGKELEYLNTLLDIHKLRFGTDETIKYIVKGTIENQMIPPLSIITIVENAFKYGDLSDLRNPMRIELDLTPNEINFICKNKKKRGNYQFSQTGIGITNLRKRLELTFRDKFEINVVNDLEFYTFNLLIKN